MHARQASVQCKCFAQTFGLSASLVPNQPHVSDLSYARLRKEIVDFSLFGLQWDPIHENGAVVALGFFCLPFCLFEVFNQILLLPFGFLAFVGTTTFFTSVVRAGSPASLVPRLLATLLLLVMSR